MKTLIGIVLCVMIACGFAGVVYAAREMADPKPIEPTPYRVIGNMALAHLNATLVLVVTIDGAEYVVITSPSGVAICPKSASK